MSTSIERYAVSSVLKSGSAALGSADAIPQRCLLSHICLESTATNSYQRYCIQLQTCTFQSIRCFNGCFGLILCCSSRPSDLSNKQSLYQMAAHGLAALVLTALQAVAAQTYVNYVAPGAPTNFYTPDTPQTSISEVRFPSGSQDLPLDQEPLQRAVSGFQPEQVNLIYISPTEVTATWNTGTSLAAVLMIGRPPNLQAI